VAVETAKVDKKDIKLVKSFSASLEGEEQENIISKISERIIEINVKSGQYVSKGTVVIGLDKAGATSQYFQVRAGYLNSEKDLDRMKALFKEGAVSRQLLDGTQTQYDVAKANFEAVKSTVELTAPLSGIVTAINVNVGELANPGMAIVVIAKIENMKALFNVGEDDIAGIYSGQPADVFSELKPDLIMNGKIVQLSKSANVQSRTFDIKTLFHNTTDKWFKPGMFCRVNVELKSLHGITAIPFGSVVKDNNSSRVFVISDGKASFRNITTGISDGENVEVLSGLKDGDEIVTLGMNKLKEGTIVRVSKNR
jgi:RND family efflux transporter MFP subunit